MKKLSLLFFPLLVILSCVQNQTEKYVIISGIIDDNNVKEIQIASVSDTVVIEVSKYGNFKDTILIEGGYYNLTVGDSIYEIYLKPSFLIDIKVGKAIEFAGIGSTENNYLRDKKILSKNLRRLDDYQYNTQLQEKPFLNLMDSLLNVKIKLLSESENKICSEFDFIERNKLIYEYKNNKALYDVSRRIVTGNKDFHVSSDYYTNLFNDINVNDSNLVKLDGYISFVDSYIWQTTKSIQGENGSIDFYFIYMTVLNEKVKNDKIKEKLSFKIGNYKLDMTNQLDDVYSLIVNNLSKQGDKSKIERKYKTLKKVEKGAQSPEFQFIDINGNTVTLKDLRGKIVYIEIWSTGCAPCMAEIPYQKKLEKYYQGKNICFVGINVGDEEKHWKNTVREKQLGGIQLHASDERDKFFKDYLVRGIPRYILLDEEGKIISSNAKRPSDEKLKEQLDKII
jgi:peroxiredoxin